MHSVSSLDAAGHWQSLDRFYFSWLHFEMKVNSTIVALEQRSHCLLSLQLLRRLSVGRDRSSPAKKSISQQSVQAKRATNRPGNIWIGPFRFFQF